jgi:hypothetical protein
MNIIKHYKGMWYNWRGHHTEYVVASHLHGTLYSNPNQPRYDLTVNGIPVQVKRGSWASVREHIVHYGKPGVIWIPNSGGNVMHYIIDGSLLLVSGLVSVFCVRAFAGIRKQYFSLIDENTGLRDTIVDLQRHKVLCETHHRKETFMKSMVKAAGIGGATAGGGLLIAKIAALCLL